MASEKGEDCKDVCFMKFVDHEAGDQNANFVLDSCEKNEKDLDADGVMDKYSYLALYFILMVYWTSILIHAVQV